LYEVIAMTNSNWIYLAFVLGNLLFSLMLANSVVRMHKRFDSFRGYFAFYWIAMLGRSVLEVIFYGLLLGYPQALPTVFAWIGVTFPPEILRDPRVAFVAGFFFDAILGQLVSIAPDKFKWLTKWIPESPAGEPDDAAADKAAAAGAGK
jgi:hypothetical protein